MPQPEFVDFHTHPDIKSFLSKNDESDRENCWAERKRSKFLEIIDYFLGDIMPSQCSLSQLKYNSGALAVVGLCAFERAMATGDLFEILGVHVTLKKLAKIFNDNNHNDFIDPALLERLSYNSSRYFDTFRELLNHLIISKGIDPGYNLLKSIDGYDPERLNLILSVEGGHNLCCYCSGPYEGNDPVCNLGKLKNGDHRFLSLSIAHVEQNDLCNHAFAMKFLKDPRFIPVGNGITQLGKKVIEEALKKPNRMLIDIRHMSLKSRLQYYDILENYFPERIPVMVSHAGLTGISYRDITAASAPRFEDGAIAVEFNKNKGLENTWFNPWSVNLYDEEIGKIIGSGGLIGINLDERILGMKQKLKSQRIEYFSEPEFNELNIKVVPGLIQEEEIDELDIPDDAEEALRQKVVMYVQILVENPTMMQRSQELYQEIVMDYDKLKLKEQQNFARNEDKRIKSIKYLCNNILHIVEIGGDEAWKHICIGSDFDGFINSISGCNDSTCLKQLSSDLEKWLPYMAKFSNMPIIVTDIRQKVADIMSGNAYRFLQIHFS